VSDQATVRRKWLDVLASTDDPDVQERAKGVLSQLGVAPEKVDKYIGHKAQTDALKAEPSPWSVGGVAEESVNEIGRRLKGFAQGAKTLGQAAWSPIDTVTTPEKRRQLLRGVDDMVTWGYGGQLAKKIENALPESARLGPTLEETEESDQQAAPEFRQAGQMAGMFVPGATSSLAKGGASLAAKAIKPGATVAREAVRGGGRAVLGYGMTAPVVAGLHAGNENRRLEAAGEALGDPLGPLTAAATGAATSGLGKLIGGAPKRAEESEIGGLKEGVQYKTRIQKFDANEGDIRAVLTNDKELRSLIKTDPQKAAALAEKRLETVADAELEPFYQHLKDIGQDNVPLATVEKQLQGVRASLKGVAKKPLRESVDGLIEDFRAEAAANGGSVSASELLRPDATTFQQLGFGNLANFGPVPLVKQLKQQVGGAIRSAIGDHMESVGADPKIKAAFRDANKRVSTWNRITEILDEKATRADANAPAAGDLVGAGIDAIRRPVRTALGVAPLIGDAIDRRVLGPAVSSKAGKKLAPAGRAAINATPRLTLPGFMPEIEQAYAEALQMIANQRRQREAMQEEQENR
jgi:hypothetical protein